MGRLGAKTKEEVQQIVNVVEQKDSFVIEGVYTHFATADEQNVDYFRFNTIHLCTC